MYFKMLMLALMTASIGLPTAASAQESYYDAGSKMRGEFGRTARRRPRPVYRAPVASVEVPSERRSYSYEPAAPAMDSHCHSYAVPADTAQRDTRSYRSYSYEPTYPRYNAPSRPRPRGPSYLLPKSHPDRYR